MIVYDTFGKDAEFRTYLNMKDTLTGHRRLLRGSPARRTLPGKTPIIKMKDIYHFIP